MTDPRLKHNEEAAELLRQTQCDLRGMPLRRAGEPYSALHNKLVTWLGRDQALSAPTAESGKDSSPEVAPGEHCLADIPFFRDGLPAGVDTCRLARGHVGPHRTALLPRAAPVAEAPERVTHEEARDHVHLWASLCNGSAKQTEARNRLREYIDQQEQSEREVARLSGLLHTENKTAIDLRSQLTAAERKAEGLRLDLEELKRSEDEALEELAIWRRDAARYEAERDAAQHALAESERKLGEAVVMLMHFAGAPTASGSPWAEVEAWIRKRQSESTEPSGLPGHARECSATMEDSSLCDCTYGNPTPSSTEPAGVEAGKTRMVKGHTRECNGELDPDGGGVPCDCEGMVPADADPTPTETEALKADGVRELLLKAARECMAAKREGRPMPDYLPLRRTANPAPPKPGGEVLTVELAGLIDEYSKLAAVVNAAIPEEHPMRAVSERASEVTLRMLRGIDSRLSRLEREGGDKS